MIYKIFGQANCFVSKQFQKISSQVNHWYLEKSILIYHGWSYSEERALVGLDLDHGGGGEPGVKILFGFRIG